MISVYLLYVLSTLCFIFIINLFKEHKKTLNAFFIIVFTIFISPALYYIFNGQSYKNFNKLDFNYYLLISSIVFIQYSILLILKQGFNINRQYQYKEKLNKPILRMSDIYFAILIALILLYTVRYFEKFPLIYAIKYKDTILRPDTTGNIPHYFTYSTFTSFVIPSFYFYYKDKLGNGGRTLSLLIFITMSFLSVIGGNKGSIVYLYIFIWLYIYKGKINKQVIFMGLGAVLVYSILKTGKISFDNNQPINFTIFISALRRFLVTQGAMFINRLHLLNSNYLFSQSVKIKNEVYRYVYGNSVGSAPTYFLGDLIVKYGYITGLLVHFIVITIIILFSKIIDNRTENRLFTKWSFFCILYLLGMSSLSLEFVYRTIIILTNFLVVLKLDKLNYNCDLSTNKYC